MTELDRERRQIREGRSLVSRGSVLPAAVGTDASALTGGAQGLRALPFGFSTALRLIEPIELCGQGRRDGDGIGRPA